MSETSAIKCHRPNKKGLCDAAQAVAKWGMERDEIL